MNDTTRWIMIILLLLLIAAAVFMLLRSPGKDKDEQDADLDRGSDRDGVPPRREDPAVGGTGRGVYDQEADHRSAAPVETSAHDETATMPVEGRAAQVDGPVHGTSTYDDGPAPAGGTPDPATDRDLDGDGRSDGDLRADRTASAYEDGRLREEPAATHDDAEPYRPEAGATETAVRPGATAVDAGTRAGTHEAPAPDRDDRSGRDAMSAAPVREDRDAPRTGDDHGGHGAAHGVEPLTDGQITDGGRDEPLTRDQQEPFVPEAEEDRRGQEHQSLPVDAGTGAPQTADEIVEGDRLHDARGARGATAAPAFDDGTAHRTDEPARHRDDETVQQRVDESSDRQEGTREDGGGYAPVFAESTYGAGSAEPLDDGSGPAGWEVKGNIGSMLFHTPESPSWDAVRAEVWFESEDAARAAGFAHWDRRRR